MRENDDEQIEHERRYDSFGKEALQGKQRVKKSIVERGNVVWRLFSDNSFHIL